jgi:hypothetical protein
VPEGAGVWRGKCPGLLHKALHRDDGIGIIFIDVKITACQSVRGCGFADPGSVREALAAAARFGFRCGAP